MFDRAIVKRFCLREVLALGVSILGVVGMPLSRAIAQEKTQRLDLRNQLVPILEENIEASNYSVLMRSGTTEDTSFPLRIMLQSISPVSKEAPRAVVQLLLQNTGDRPLSLPVSRETKVLHYPGNSDRRIFSCGLYLTPPASAYIGGVTAYSASTDRSSLVLLAPKDSLQFIFETKLDMLWEEEAAKWHSEIAAGKISVSVNCGQQTLTPRPDNVGPPPRPGQISYWGLISRLAKSENSVPLTVAP